jgi:hypothetical protein
MNVLYLSQKDNEELVLLFESNFGGKVYFSNSIDHALKVIASSPIDLVVTLNEMKDLLPLFQKVLVKKIIVGLKTQSSSNHPANVTPIVITPNFYQDLLVLAEKLTGKKAGNLPEFCPIKTRLLLSVCPLKADIFVKIGARYIKIYKEGDEFDAKDFANITEKKQIEYLFIQKEKINEFINSFIVEENRKLQRPPEDFAATIGSYSSLYEVVQGFSSQIGFNKDVQILAKTQVKSVLHSMGKKPSLNQVLSKLDQFKGEYIGVHSALTGFIASAICSQMDWGSEQTYYKLTLAAFLHDIAFTDNRLSMCHSVQEAIDLGYSDDKIELFKKHPEIAANLARSFHEVPPDVDNIIAQHHEFPDFQKALPTLIFHRCQRFFS